MGVTTPLIVVGVIAAIALMWSGRRRRHFRRAIVWTDAGVQYKCVNCDKWHTGIPNWHFEAPDNVVTLPRGEQAKRVFREHDGLVLDRKWFYTLALLEMPVQGVADPFAWGVWVNLRGEDVKRFVAMYNDPARVGGDEFAGALGNALPGYADTFKLPVRVITRPYPTRPLVLVADDSHPVALDQRDGIAPELLRQSLTPLFT